MKVLGGLSVRRVVSTWADVAELVQEAGNGENATPTASAN